MDLVIASITAIIAVLVFLHAWIRLRADIIERSWSNQQQLNIAVLGDSKTQIAYDCLVAGELHSEEIVNQKIVFICFIMLNRVQQIWKGHRSLLFSSTELHEETDQTIALVSKNERLLEYCLKRGYDKHFVRYASGRAKYFREQSDEIRSVKTFLQEVKNSKINSQAHENDA